MIGVTFLLLWISSVLHISCSSRLTSFRSSILKIWPVLRPKIQIQSLEDLHRHQSFPWAKLSINAPLPSISQTHPTIKLLHRRYSHSQREGEDAFLEGVHEKIGLAIEGGGMRSCVAAGSVLALSHLNLTQYFDVIYGSSAGSMIGAYLISQQVQQASHLYCNLLSSPLRSKNPRSNSSSSSPPSPKFIRTGAIFNELIPETLRASNSTSLLNLDYLLNEIMNRSIYALDWDSFQNNERKQKLSILVSDTQETKSRTLSRDKGNYRTKDELLSCLRASMLVPGVTGAIMRILQDETPFIVPQSRSFSGLREFFGLKKRKPLTKILSENIRENPSLEESAGTHLVDAFICEPIPYRTAIQENCTHIVVLRTRPDPCSLVRKGGQFYNLLVHNFFKRYNETKIWEFIKSNQPKRIYAEDLFLLAEGAKGPEMGVDVSQLFDEMNGNHAKTVHLLPISCQDCVEISQIETNRQVIFNGMVDGAARVLTLLGPIVGINSERDRKRVLLEIFPDLTTQEADAAVPTKKNILKRLLNPISWSIPKRLFRTSA